MELLPYLDELLSVAVIAVFMAISPGADFAMVTRNAICHSRSAGVYSALGVSLAIWLHVAYSIAGLAVIISKSILLFSIIKYCGAAYLIYVGWKTFTSPETPLSAQQTSSHTPGNHLSNRAAFRIGCVTNALNPKTTIFFLSIFTQVVNPNTPLGVQLVYGAIISLAHLAWFSGVAVFLTQPALLRRFTQYRKYIERAVGTILVGFGLKVAASANN